jgi:diaminopimelate decarboxylase
MSSLRQNMPDIIADYAKRIWTDRVPLANPGIFHKHINALDNKKLIRSAEKFGTPQYVLNEEELVRRAEFFRDTFKEHIPGSEFFYAAKCNDLPYLINILKGCGFNADVAGLFELKLALKLKFNKIIFTSPGKDEEEIRLSIENSSKVILNIDNLDELRKLMSYLEDNNIRKKVCISFRVNPDKNLSKNWSKYGIDLCELKKAVDTARKNPYLVFTGIHFHSSWNINPEMYVEKIRILGEYLKKNLVQETRGLKFLDIGGGFFPEDVAVLTKFSYKGDLVNLIHEYAQKNNEDPDLVFNPYQFTVKNVTPLKEFAKRISASLRRHIYPLNSKIKIYLEPGRFLVTHSTSILLKVTALKDNSVIVDGGINLVGDYRFEEYSFAPIVNLSRPSLTLRRKTIYGPLCDPSDLWGYSYYGSSICKGDILAVLHQGAYTYACAWKFIKPTAPYIAMGKKLTVAKEKETFEDRYGRCAFK